jgi:hypothetical protein
MEHHSLCELGMLRKCRFSLLPSATALEHVQGIEGGGMGGGDGGGVVGDGGGVLGGGGVGGGGGGGGACGPSIGKAGGELGEGGVEGGVEGGDEGGGTEGGSDEQIIFSGFRKQAYLPASLVSAWWHQLHVKSSFCMYELSQSKCAWWMPA